MTKRKFRVMKRKNPYARCFLQQWHHIERQEHDAALFLHVGRMDNVRHDLHESAIIFWLILHESAIIGANLGKISVVSKGKIVFFVVYAISGFIVRFVRLIWQFVRFTLLLLVHTALIL